MLAETGPGASGEMALAMTMELATPQSAAASDAYDSDLVEAFREAAWSARAWTLPRSARLAQKRYQRVLVRGGRCCLKRAIDILAASALLVISAPLLVPVALLIKLTDGGPVLFCQQRVGRWGRQFWFPKFRSMMPDADQALAQLISQNDHRAGITFKMRKDPRMTWIGRIIRKFSIDELPQLWCVLRGEMSLVGPRPPLPREVACYTIEQRRRLDVVPGLTCIWQISGRGNVPFPQQLQMDVEYIERQGLLLDLRILAKTVPAVVLGRGAY